MLQYKFEIIAALKAAGYNTNTIRKNKIFAESTLQKFREGLPCGAKELDKLCALLDCQPGDILEYVPDDLHL